MLHVGPRGMQVVDSGGRKKPRFVHGNCALRLILQNKKLLGSLLRETEQEEREPEAEMSNYNTEVASSMMQQTSKFPLPSQRSKQTCFCTIDWGSLKHG